MNRSTAKRFSWDNTENSWSFCSEWVYPEFTEFWDRAEIWANLCFSGQNLVVPLNRCQTNANTLLVFFMSSAHICRDLLLPSAGWGWEGAMGRLQEIPAGAGAGECRERGRSRAGHNSWTLGFHPGSPCRVISTARFLSSSAENIAQMFPENLPTHGSSKDLLKGTKDLGYS